MVDKPEKSRDLYHTMYALTGLSLSQWGDTVFEEFEENELGELNPIYNVVSSRLEEAKKHFAAKQ